MRKKSLFLILCSILFLAACGQQAQSVSTPLLPNATQISPTTSPVDTVASTQHMLLARANGQLQRIDLANQAHTPLELPGLEQGGLSLSPDGQQVAYWDGNQLMSYSLETGEAVTVHPFLGSYGSQIAWMGDYALLMDCSPEDHSNTEVCRVDLATGEVQMLTDMSAQVVDAFDGVDWVSYTPQSEWAVFSFAMAPPGDGYFQKALYLLNITTGEVRDLFDERGQAQYVGFEFPRLSPDGSKVLMPARTTDNDHVVVLLDTGTGVMRTLFNGGENRMMVNLYWWDETHFIGSWLDTTGGGENYGPLMLYNLSGEAVERLDVNPQWQIISVVSGE